MLSTPLARSALSRRVRNLLRHFSITEWLHDTNNRHSNFYDRHWHQRQQHHVNSNQPP